MKQCKDCTYDGYCAQCWLKYECGFRSMYESAEECTQYKRTWWKFWAPKVLLITLALLLGGCSQHILTLPDGSTYKANRFLDSTKIGSVSYDDGSFTLDGYESDLTRALGIIDRLIAREEKP